MTTFLIFAFLLIGIALGCVLPPLLKKSTTVDTDAQAQVNLAVLRDQLHELNQDVATGILPTSEQASARHEIEQRVLQDVTAPIAISNPIHRSRWPALVIAIVLPLAAIAFYLVVGTPQVFNPQPPPIADNAPEMTPQQLSAMLAKVTDYLKKNPNDTRGWLVLARANNALGKHQESSQAYARLAALMPNDATILTDYADALALAHGSKLQGEPEQLLGRALQIDPTNVKTSALFANAAFERKDYATAIARWQNLRKNLPADTELARAIDERIGTARQLLRPGATPAGATSMIASARIEGTVELDPTLRAQVKPEDSVFIFARAIDGPRIPLAVLRKQVKDLPLKFVLDDSLAMVPSAKISGFSEVAVGAKVSKSGSATPATGDLESAVTHVQLGAANVKLSIATQRP